MLCRSAGYYSGEGCGTTTTVGFQDTQSIAIVTLKKQGRFIITFEGHLHMRF